MSAGGLNSNSNRNNANANAKKITPSGFFPQTTTTSAPIDGLSNQQQQQQQQHLNASSATSSQWNGINTNNNAVVLQYYDPSTGNILQCYQQPQQHMMVTSNFNGYQSTQPIHMASQSTLGQQQRGYNVTSPSAIINVSGYALQPPPPPPPPLNATTAISSQPCQQQQYHYQNQNQIYNQNQILQQNSYDNSSGHRIDSNVQNGQNNDNFNRNNRGRGRSNGRANFNNQPMHQRNNTQSHQQQSYKRGRDQNYDCQYKRHKNVDNNQFTAYDQQQSQPQQLLQQYTCEPCSMSFDTKVALDNHIKSHIKCSVCEFYAIPKIINGHYAKNHGKFSTNGFKTITVTIPGCKVQKFRICVGNHPDDIAKWIADRKKKFPRQNVNPSSINASSAIENKQQSLHGTSNGTPGSIMETNTTITASTMDTKVDPSNVQSSSTAVGISSLLVGYESDSSNASDDEEGEVVEATTETVNVESNDNKHSGHRLENGEEEIVNDATSTTLIRETDIVASQQVDEENEQSIQTSSNHRTKICRYFARTGTCRNGMNCTFLHDTGTEKESIHKLKTVDNNTSNNNITNGTTSSILFPGNKKLQLPTSSYNNGEPSLLRKLLNEDIRRERVLTIKLLKYIVQMNFFQPTNTSNSTSGTSKPTASVETTTVTSDNTNTI
jgi:CCCH-type zinc finger/Nuclear fragile X mental retardation-interacting protein 1 (NUFIP1)